MSSPNSSPSVWLSDDRNIALATSSVRELAGSPGTLVRELFKKKEIRPCGPLFRARVDMGSGWAGAVDVLLPVPGAGTGVVFWASGRESAATPAVRTTSASTTRPIHL
jgi:hypothetical protein